MDMNDNTKKLAMDMARKLLAVSMYHQRTWFKNPWPDEEGRYLIIQSHKANDETLPVSFPHERVYYREYEDGWAISVGY